MLGLGLSAMGGFCSDAANQHLFLLLRRSCGGKQIWPSRFGSAGAGWERSSLGLRCWQITATISSLSEERHDAIAGPGLLSDIRGFFLGAATTYLSFSVWCFERPRALLLRLGLCLPPQVGWGRTCPGSGTPLGSPRTGGAALRSGHLSAMPRGCEPSLGPIQRRLWGSCPAGK